MYCILCNVIIEMFKVLGLMEYSFKIIVGCEIRLA